MQWEWKLKKILSSKGIKFWSLLYWLSFLSHGKFFFSFFFYWLIENFQSQISKYANCIMLCTSNDQTDFYFTTWSCILKALHLPSILSYVCIYLWDNNCSIALRLHHSCDQWLFPLQPRCPGLLLEPDRELSSELWEGQESCTLVRLLTLAPVILVVGFFLNVFMSFFFIIFFVCLFCCCCFFLF